MRIIAILAAFIVFPSIGEAQSHGRRCEESASGYAYSISTPSGDSRQHDLDLYFNNNSASFILVVFDEDIDVVLSTTSGLQSGDRFVHGSIRLYPGQTYSVAVACVSQSADYRLSIKRGEEVSLTTPVVLGAHQGLDAGEAAISLDMEASIREAKARMR